MIEKFRKKLAQESNEEFYYEIVDMPFGNMSSYEESIRDCILDELEKRLQIKIWKE